LGETNLVIIEIIFSICLESGLRTHLNFAVTTVALAFACI